MSYYRNGRELTPGTQEYDEVVEGFRTRKPGERCPESGRYVFTERYSDRCPGCGRVVTSTSRGKLPEHKVPKYLKETW